jgi:hypothetical protein
VKRWVWPRKGLCRTGGKNGGKLSCNWEGPGRLKDRTWEQHCGWKPPRKASRYKKNIQLQSPAQPIVTHRVTIVKWCESQSLQTLEFSPPPMQQFPLQHLQQVVSVSLNRFGVWTFLTATYFSSWDPLWSCHLQ